MKRTGLILGIAVLLLAGFGSSTIPASPAPQQLPAPEFPAGVDVVNVDVVALDSAGNPIEGLTADDFTLTDEGKVTLNVLERVAESLPG
jgi:hypothetical protein